jgi:hypothetical protein
MRDGACDACRAFLFWANDSSAATRAIYGTKCGVIIVMKSRELTSVSRTSRSGNINS